MTGYVADTGALIAIDRGADNLRWLIELLGRRGGGQVAVPTGVLAQAWRGGRGQDRLARFLRLPGIDLVGLSPAHARAVGTLLGATGTTDVVDAWVVACARRLRRPVLTSDPGDLARLDPSAELITI